MKKKEASVAKAKKSAKKKVVAKKKVIARKAAPKKKVVAKKAAPKKAAPKKTIPKKILQAKPAAKKIDLSGFISPLDDRIIIQISEGERKTAGGLYIPDTVSNVSGHREGKVLSVGRGHRDKKGRIRPMDVQTGNTVVFSEYAGSKITYQGQDLVILRETDIMGVLD